MLLSSFSLSFYQWWFKTKMHWLQKSLLVNFLNILPFSRKITKKLWLMVQYDLIARIIYILQRGFDFQKMDLAYVQLTEAYDSCGAMDQRYRPPRWWVFQHESDRIKFSEGKLLNQSMCTVGRGMEFMWGHGTEIQTIHLMSRRTYCKQTKNYPRLEYQKTMVTLQVD